jgi:hypothetical protein
MHWKADLPSFSTASSPLQASSNTNVRSGKPGNWAQQYPVICLGIDYQDPQLVTSGCFHTISRVGE